MSQIRRDSLKRLSSSDVEEMGSADTRQPIRKRESGAQTPIGCKNMPRPEKSGSLMGLWKQPMGKGAKP